MRNSCKLQIANQLWQNLINFINKNQIDTIILGCTELNYFSQKNYPTIQLIDSSELLAKETVNFYLQILNKH